MFMLGNPPHFWPRTSVNPRDFFACSRIRSKTVSWHSAMPFGFRNRRPITALCCAYLLWPYSSSLWWARLDSNQRIPKEANLQSAAIATMRHAHIIIFSGTQSASACCRPQVAFYWWPPHRPCNCRSTFFIFRITKDYVGGDAATRTRTTKTVGHLSRVLRYHYSTSPYTPSSIFCAQAPRLSHSICPSRAAFLLCE